jgi:hypothetical protein
MVHGVPGRTPIERLRELCLALPETSERLAHGHPSFYVRQTRNFVMYLDDHHGDGRVAIWAAAGPGMQAMLVDAAPEQYFVPPYVGHRGWIGLRLDRDVPWEEIAGIVEDAWLHRAPATLVASIRPGE